MALDSQIVASAIGAGANLLGGIFGNSAQSEANETNLRIARETNAMNDRLFHEQLAYQTSEREATQEYNTPKNQRARYEAAGLNPYAMLGNFEAGNAQMQSAPSPNAMQAAQVQPVDALSKAVGTIGSELGQSMVYAAQSDNINMDTQIKKIELTYKAAEKKVQIQNQLADIESKKSKTAEDYQKIANLKTELQIQDENLDILRSTKSELKAQQIARTKRAELDNEYQDLQNKYQSWLNDYAKKHGQAELRQIASVIAANMAQAGSLNAEKVLKELEQKGVKLDNVQKSKLNPLLREAQRIENKKKRYEAKYPSYFEREIQNPLVNFMNWFGTPLDGSKQTILPKVSHE